VLTLVRTADAQGVGGHAESRWRHQLEGANEIALATKKDQAMAENAAITCGHLKTPKAATIAVNSATFRFARAAAYIIMNVYAIKMAAVLRKLLWAELHNRVAGTFIVWFKSIVCDGRSAKRN
jgi:hypothetical protein